VLLVPAIQPYIIEPIWVQFEALLPERKADHPLGCHKPRIPDRLVFEKLVQILVFGCAYWRIADECCSESTLRRRRDEWIGLGLMETLREIVLEAYDRLIGLELADLAVDGCITKAPCGGQKAGRSPVDRGKGGVKRSMVVEAKGIPLGTVIAPANHHDSPLLEKTLDTLEPLGELPDRPRSVHLDRAYDSALPARSWRLVGCSARSPRRASRLRLEPGCGGLWSARTPGTTPTRSWCGVPRGGGRPSISG
jgi:transposase